MSFFHKQKNLFQSGQALVEVMIAAGIIGALSIVVVKLSEGGNKAVSRVEKALEVSDLNQEVVTYVSKKPGCGNTLFLPRPVSSFSGTNKITIPSIKNDTNVSVFTIPFDRSMVKFNSAVVSDYDATLKTARLTNNYTFRLSPTESVTKVKTTTISMTVDGAGNATGCIAKAAEVDGPWTQVDNGIHFSNGSVGINAVPADNKRSLIVTGDTVIGSFNKITVPFPLYNTVIGGTGNEILGASSQEHTILGGNNNKISGGYYTTMVGGAAHNSLATGAFFGGGQFNSTSATATSSVHLGGFLNQTKEQRSVSIAGTGNVAAAVDSTTIGGSGNRTEGIFSMILNGTSTIVSGDDSLALGTLGSTITGKRSIMLGGFPSPPLGYFSTPVGNTINSHAEIMIGGHNNFIDSTGWSNDKYGMNAIFGGYFNKIQDLASRYNYIIGGARNEVNGGEHVVILGGFRNQVTSANIAAVIASQGTTMVDGGQRTAVIACETCDVSGGGLSGQLALGWRASLKHPSSIVLSGNATPFSPPFDKGFQSTRVSQFNARYSGGFRFCTLDNEDGSDDDGCFRLEPGTGGLITSSDRNAKTSIVDTDVAMEDFVLKQISNLPVSFWKYKSHKTAATRNLGPMAQDFHRLISGPLKLQSKEKEISSGDVSGVQLVAIKGITRKLQVLEVENDELKQKNAKLASRLESLELKMDLLFKNTGK